MKQQQLLATLIQLSDEQQHRIAKLLNRLEGQAQTLTRASQQAAQAGRTPSTAAGRKPPSTCKRRFERAWKSHCTPP